MITLAAISLERYSAGKSLQAKHSLCGKGGFERSIKRSVFAQLIIWKEINHVIARNG